MLYQLPKIAPLLASEHAVIRQPFMSRAMWFAWLIRSDVRDGAGLGNAEAQREFVIWWMLRGSIEYPRSWSVDEAQLEVAMEPVFIEPGIILPRLVRAMYRKRADLQQAFPLKDDKSVAELLAWYRVHAAKDLSVYPALPPAFSKLTEVSTTAAPWNADTVPAFVIAVCLHRSSVALQARFNTNTTEGRSAFTVWFAEQGLTWLPPVRLSLTPKIDPLSAPAGGFGVNLVGYPRGEFGIGEDIRMLSCALDAAGVPHVVIDLRHGSQARQNDETLAGRIVPEIRYDITVFCQSSFDTARVWLEFGPTMFAARINIGNWPWELERFPSFWKDVYDLVDEVWAASRFTLAAYAADIGHRAYLMPPAVAVSARSDPAKRGKHDPGAPFVFLCPFDPNSYPERKNPQAAIRAFRLAFPGGDEAVRLVVKANGSLENRPEWGSVFELAADDKRVEILQGSSTRAEFLEMICQANCLVSTHRSEGFGRNMAEAILLGVLVLATGYSGCTDFLEQSECIAFRPRQLGPDDYPYGSFMVWADPDIADLVRLMRDASRGVDVTAARARTLQKVHSPLAAGERYRVRLCEVWETRVEAPLTVPRRRAAGSARDLVSS